MSNMTKATDGELALSILTKIANNDSVEIFHGIVHGSAAGGDMYATIDAYVELTQDEKDLLDSGPVTPEPTTSPYPDPTTLDDTALADAIESHTVYADELHHEGDSNDDVAALWEERAYVKLCEAVRFRRSWAVR